MKYLKLLFVILMLFLVSCKGEQGESGIDGRNGTNGTNGIDGLDGLDGDIIRNLSGKFQKGPCRKGGEIRIQPVDSLTMNQTGEHYIGFTKDDSGSYDVPAAISEEYAEVFFEGTCSNELTGGEDIQRLSGIIKISDPVNNINPLTKIRSQVARWVFDDTTNDIDQSIAEAERLILLYLGMPALSERFTEMNLEQDSTNDAILLLANSMILYGRTPVEQSDYIVGIANGIITNDLTLKSEIADTIDSLPLMTIKSNLAAKYAELDISADSPPIWMLGAPSYYDDLMSRTPTITGTFNLDDTSFCNFDQSTFNTFAIPIVFDVTNDIESSKYIAINLDKDLSIWTKGTHVNGHLAPETKLLDIAQLREIILDNPKKMNYNGLLGDNHGLINGVDYYMVIRSDTDFTLSTGCEGGLLAFGRKLASQDEGSSWIGWNNNTPFFRKSGIKMFMTD